eukprot:346109-Chlamydomonas_euryale.AAC.1
MWSFNLRRGAATQRDCPCDWPPSEDIDIVGEPPVKKRILPKNAPPDSVLQFSVMEKPAAPIGPPGLPLPVPPARLARLPAPPSIQRTVELQPTLNA